MFLVQMFERWIGIENSLRFENSMLICSKFQLSENYICLQVCHFYLLDFLPSLMYYNHYNIAQVFDPERIFKLKRLWCYRHLIPKRILYFNIWFFSEHNCFDTRLEEIILPQSEITEVFIIWSLATRQFKILKYYIKNVKNIEQKFKNLKV